MTEIAHPDEKTPASVAELLDLVRLAADSYLAPALGGTQRRSLFGGQVMAQAARAAANTVPVDRVIHSVHGQFLHPGDAQSPVVLRVWRDRDGGRYSSRRVVAAQGDTTIFCMMSSFQRPKAGPDFQATTAPTAEPPDGLPAYPLDARRMFDMEARVPNDPEPWYRWPPRLWVRVRQPVGDDGNDHQCALLFMSDLCTGLSRAPAIETVGLLPSLDHSVWLHRQARADDWLLIDLKPESTGGGRGMYLGRIYRQDGTLVATLAQESLFDGSRSRPVLRR